MQQGQQVLRNFTIIKDGKEFNLQCQRVELKRQVSQHFQDIPYDQIVIIDSDTNLVAQDLNSLLTQSQIQNKKIYKIADLNNILKEYQALRNYAEKQEEEKKNNLQLLEARRQEIEDLRAKAEQITKIQLHQNQTQEQQQQQITADYNKKVNENSELQLKYNKLSQDFEKAQNQLSVCQQNIQDQQKNFEKVQQELSEEFQFKLQEKEQQQQNLKNEFGQAIANQYQQYQGLTHYIEQLLQTFQQVQKENIELSTELEALKDSQRKIQEAQKKQLKDQVQKLEDEKEKFFQENRLKMTSLINDLKLANKKILELETEIREGQPTQMIQAMQY